jgi:hypothetical protein
MDIFNDFEPSAVFFVPWWLATRLGHSGQTPVASMTVHPTIGYSVDRPPQSLIDR